jgi:hypothetical protein
MIFDTFHIFLAFIYFIFFPYILSLNVELNLRPSILVIKDFMIFETFHIFLAFFNFKALVKYIFTIIFLFKIHSSHFLGCKTTY